MSVSTGAAANSNSSGGTLAQDSPAAFDVIVHLLRTTGSLAYVALLHGSPGIFEAAARNVLTGRCQRDLAGYQAASSCCGQRGRRTSAT